MNINQMFLQNHVMLPPSAYPYLLTPGHLMRHETGSEHNLVVYFSLVNKEQQKSIRFYIHYHRRNGHGGKQRVFNIKMSGNAFCNKPKASHDEQEGTVNSQSEESENELDNSLISQSNANAGT